MKLMPTSLAGQMAVLIGAALLMAQSVNIALLLNEREKLTLAQTEAPGISRFVAALSDVAEAPLERREAVVEDLSRRGADFALSADNPVAAEAQDLGLERRLAQALQEADVKVAGLAGAKLARPLLTRSSEPLPPDMRALLLAARLPDGTWVQGQLPTPRRDPYLTARLVGATALLYLIVLGVTVAIARWLARPLDELTYAAEHFAGRDAVPAISLRGPADIRRLVAAFNDMNHRVLALLDEKDRMLGAIGHDLRTPLTSIRIRAESMEPEDERERLVATVDETIAVLEDILVLARTGRPREPFKVMDVSALVDTLAEEYRAMGRPVACVESPRAVAEVQPVLLRRALRNLIENALAYGGSATLDAATGDGEVRLIVRDDGPGLPEADLTRVLEPFVRGEASRNRETGGSGLGLAIASAVASGHGGRLTLANRPSGGLEATLHLPA